VYRNFNYEFASILTSSFETIYFKKKTLFSCYRWHLKWQILTNNLYDNFFKRCVL